MREYWQTVQAFSPSVRRFLLAFALVIMVGFGMLAVVQNLYLLRLGFDARFIGLLMGVGQLAWAAAALPGGFLSNRIGLRNGLILGIALFGLSILFPILVETRPAAQWPIWLLGGQVIGNIGIAFATVSIPPYLMAVTTERERRHAFAAFQALIPAAALVGSVIAGLLPGLLARQLGLTLDQPEPYRLTLWVAPFLVWLAILPMIGAERVQIGGSHIARAEAGRAPFGLLVFFGSMALLAAIGEGAVRTFFNVYLDTGLGVSTAAIGVIMGIAQLLPMFVAFGVPLLLARLGTGRSLLVGVLAIAGCLLILAGFPFVAAAALGYMGIMAAFTVTSASRDLFGQELVAVRWRTSSQATAMIGLALGFATAGVVGGYLIEAVSFSALFFAAALAAVLAAGLLTVYLRTRQDVVTAAVEAAPILPEETVPLDTL